MNCWNGTGRFCQDPEIKTTEKNGKEMKIANFTLAVNRKYKSEEQSADFIRCVAFGKTAEFIETYFQKGMKADVIGEIRTSSFEKDGQRNYYTNIQISSIEFGESKSAYESKGSGVPQAQPSPEPTPTGDDGFMKVDNVDDEGLPFNF